jgi:leukotriene-A4 hydrolase
VEVTCPEVASALWARLQPFAKPTVVLSPADAAADDGAACERGLDGTWVACGINPVLLFSRYGSGGHFSPHTDGNTVVDLNHRSLCSVIIYLNDCAEGGETALFAPPADAPADARRLFRRDEEQRLRWPPGWVADVAAPVGGSALVFAQHVAHEGAPVGPGCEKNIIRTGMRVGQHLKSRNYLHATLTSR